MNVNIDRFVLPILYKALQTDDEKKIDEAAESWEKSSIEYQEYLSTTEWPEWLRDFIFGDPLTGMNNSEKLHDAEIKEFWFDKKKSIIILSTKNCVWDARHAVVVIEYKLASIPIVLEGDVLDNSNRYFLYDQFFNLGSGLYRHYIMFNNMSVQIDFSYLKTTRFEMSN